MRACVPIATQVVTLLGAVLLASGCKGGGGGASEGSDPLLEPVPIPSPSQDPGPAPEAQEKPVTFSVSGSIQVPATAAADGDVNDPDAPYVANDRAEEAQPLPNPVTVGGYANQPGAGEPGRSAELGDALDVYRVTLAAGQTITLEIADPEAGDLDLFLLGLDEDLIDSSEGTGGSELLSVTTAGTYYLMVTAYRGASNYVLSIGSAAGSAVGSTLRLRDDFLPGQVIVRFQERAAANGIGSGPVRAAASLGLVAKAGLPGRSMLFGIADAQQPVQATVGRLRASQSSQTGFLDRVLRRADATTRRKRETIRMIKALRGRAEVRFAEPNYLRRAYATLPDDPRYPTQWHYPLINLPDAWDITTGDRGVIVAVIDSGVLVGHPELRGQLVAGYDFIRDPDNALDGDGIDSDPNEVPNPERHGRPFHGTHVAGTVAAATNNATGVAGVSWATRIMPVRVLGRVGAYSYDTIQAVRYAAGLPNDSGTLPAKKADVINLSLGGFPSNQAEQAALAEVREQGVVIVASAGNNNTDVPSYPASYTGVISVGAVNIGRRKASYSNHGPTIDLAAPGGEGASDSNGDGYPDAVLSTQASESSGDIVFDTGFMFGTSMAAPHVSGVVALMKAVNPELTPPQLDDLIVAGRISQDLGDPGRDDQFGYGLIDAYQAVLAAQGLGAVSPLPAGPVLLIEPSTISLGSTQSSAAFSVRNAGGGALRVTNVTDDADWITLQEAAVDSHGLGTYVAVVDRGGLSAGGYTARISFTSNYSTETVVVTMQVAAGAAAADAGLHHVLLLEPDTGANLREIQVAAEDGRYVYEFKDVAPGTYEILAGTDADNDSVICDAGEACGGYLSADPRKPIMVDSDLEGLDFTTGFSPRDTSGRSVDSGPIH